MTKKQKLDKSKKKKKMLVYADSAICSTGFGQVAKNILKRLADEYEITQFAINHPDLRDEFGAPKKHNMPFEILEAKFLSPEDIRNGFKPSPYGKRKFAQYALTHDFDIFFTIQDPIIMKDMIEFLQREDVVKKREGFGFSPFKTVAYFPVDSDYFYKDWEEVVEKFDVAVPYTFYAKDKCLKHNPSSKVVDPIYHGIDTDVFRPLPKKEKEAIRQFYKIPPEAFVVGNVARNQPRKDPPRLIMAFKEFKKKVPDAVLVMVCDPEEVAYNLNIVNKNFGLVGGKDVFFLGPKMGEYWETAKINEIYNTFDVGLSSTTGEGFNLFNFECYATKVPVILPNNTVAQELIGENEERGLLCNSGNVSNLWTVMPYVPLDPPRPLLDIEHAAELLHSVYEKRPADKIEAAFQFAQENNWNSIATKWRELFSNL
ncbi:MAG: glycosyltransferase [Candidatus Paceibacterota bacterium]|jgi:glycosyltransferase involved in cell wall biosynthesis